MKRVLAASLLLALAVSAQAQAVTPEPKTPAGVIAADNSWDHAAIHGDGAFLSRLLLDGYVSVGPDGSLTTKQELVSGADKQGYDPKFAKAAADWKAAHLNMASVQIFGDTAVLTWRSTDAHSKTPVYSSDVFVYRNGQWHAIYSQHSTAEK